MTKKRKVPEAVLQARYAKALALHGKGELDGAEPLYRSILADMPGSFHALHMLGVLMGQRHEWNESERLLLSAVRADPGAAAAHANLGNTLRLMGQGEAAMAAYERALRLQPDHLRALKGKGLLLWQRNQREEALACYEHLLSLEPGYADGWIMRAAVFDLLGRSAEAIESYRKALEFDNVTDPDKVRYLMAALGDGSLPAASPVEYVRDLFDKYARQFDDHLVGDLHYRAPELLVAQVRPHVPAEPIDIVDLGCGTGLCGPLLKGWARSLTGLDLSPKMLEEAAGKGLYDELVAADIVAWLPQREAAFDLIIAADVFIYLGDLAPVFDAARAALRPNGLFAFSTEVGTGADSTLQKTLRFAHSAEYLQRLAEDGGWRILSLTQDVLREEAGRASPGHLIVLRRPDASG